MHRHCSSDTSSCKSKCFKITLIAIVVVAALGWVIMLLWNCLLPDVFTGVKQIGYWQALGIFLLSKILFGCHGHGRFHGRRPHWESLTPEERDQIKGRFNSRWGHWCCSDKAEDKTDSNPATHGE